METIQLKARDKHQKEFAKALKTNVRQYFKENGLTTKGDYRMIIKAIVMIGLYVAPFIIILTVDISPWFALLLTVVMGIGEAGIGMAVMHDAVHGSFSKYHWLNSLMGRTMFLLGSNVINWKIQHNLLHHTYTNIFDWDGDIETKSIIRLSKHAPLRKINRYQHIYTFFLYGFMTLLKLFTDIGQLRKYKNQAILEALNVNYRRTVLVLILTKILYLGVIFGLPLIFTDFAWWQILIGFLVMHTTASAIMSTVFQMAHVVEDLDQPLPDEKGVIHDDNYVHQLKTTSNFGGNSPILSWYIGGLDYQVEHHLFPNISHIYYNKIAPIVEKTAKEYGYPYHTQKSFLSALVSHIRMLKILGRNHNGVDDLKLKDA